MAGTGRDARTWSEGDNAAAAAYASVLAALLELAAEAAAEQLEQLARRSGRPLEEVAAGLLRRLGAGGG
jgi:hypothetical protein